MMIVLSAPSGGGKTTVTGRLLKRDPNLVRSISATTRKPRPGEKNGRDYFFLGRAGFLRMRSRRAFLEWARVHRNFYGTPKAWVEKQLSRGRDVLFVIDVQGGAAIRRQYPDALLIFLKPPSLAVLRRRLMGRGSEDSKDLGVRLADARKELRAGRGYPRQVVNGDLSKAVSGVLKIIRLERKKRRS